MPAPTTPPACAPCPRRRHRASDRFRHSRASGPHPIHPPRNARGVPLRMYWVRPRSSAMPKPIRRSMSAAGTRRTSWRCCRRWHSAPRQTLAASRLSASPTSRRTTFVSRENSAIVLNCSASRGASVNLGAPLEDVDGAFNAVVAHAREAGPFTFEGRGAGEAPTAGAVIADLVDIARGMFGAPFGRPAKSLVRSRSQPGPRNGAFYLRFEVRDAPGVLAEIARQLAQAEVSIESMIQRGRSPGGAVTIVMITHECLETALANALKAIAASDKVLTSPCMIPIEAG